MRQTYVLREPVQAYDIVMGLWKLAKASLIAGHELVIELRSATRSDKQNRLLHATLGQIAAQKEWAGAKRDVDTWKRLLMASWMRARGESMEILPALDGHGIDVVFRHTSKLTKAECNELIDFIGSWCADNGVGLVDLETGEIR